MSYFDIMLLNFFLELFKQIIFKETTVSTVTATSL